MSEPEDKKEKKIIISAQFMYSSLYTPEGYVVEGRVIICAPTGIWFHGVCNGFLIRNHEVEGWCYPLQVEYNKIPPTENMDRDWDHEVGCCLIPDDERTEEDKKKSIKHAARVEQYLKEIITPYDCPLERRRYRFDYERIDELCEAWWPVLIELSGGRECYGDNEESYSREFKGYISWLNCD